MTAFREDDINAPANRRTPGVGPGGAKGCVARQVSRSRRRRRVGHRGKLGLPRSRGRHLRCVSRYRWGGGLAIRRRDRHNGTACTYTVDGAQYVTVMAGWGGSAGLMNTPAVGAAKPGWGRILTFALDAKAALKAPPWRLAIYAFKAGATDFAGLFLPDDLTYSRRLLMQAAVAREQDIWRRLSHSAGVCSPPAN